jgi:sulfatase modifying factor 1
MEAFLRLLSLWLTVASLISPLTGQNVSELELEKSSNLNVWEGVTITPEMISESGKLLVPPAGSQQFYRMKVLLLDDLALIPQGAFTMGDSLDRMSNTPLRTVMLDAFYIGRHEVTKAEWDEVTTWGSSHGYDISGGSAKASNHPVTDVTWYDVVKWCNARSQKEGLTPIYYTNNEQTTIYKMGNVNVTNAQVKWSANGYRLPTEAEWEKAARGGLSDKRFPWGNTISHSQANYHAFYDEIGYDLSRAVNNSHPTYATGSYPYTSPVGSFAANGYGLYDMAGNVFEWCWDLYGNYAEGIQTNPRGATLGTYRVLRGGSYAGDASISRVAQRDAVNSAGSNDSIGLRVLRISPP